jgi:hypothetical protein
MYGPRVFWTFRAEARAGAGWADRVSGMRGHWSHGGRHATSQLPVALRNVTSSVRQA